MINNGCEFEFDLVWGRGDVEDGGDLVTCQKTLFVCSRNGPNSQKWQNELWCGCPGCRFVQADVGINIERGHSVIVSEEGVGWEHQVDGCGDLGRWSNKQYAWGKSEEVRNADGIWQMPCAFVANRIKLFHLRTVCDSSRWRGWYGILVMKDRKTERMMGVWSKDGQLFKLGIFLGLMTTILFSIIVIQTWSSSASLVIAQHSI